MHDRRKTAVSLRLSAADVRRIKRVSLRLGVRDSDVIRYALKTLLSKLSPLSDPTIRGRSLVPLFLEGGTDLAQYFDLDAPRLAAIINDGADEAVRVSMEDLHMLTMTGGANLLPPQLMSPKPKNGANGAHATNGANGAPGNETVSPETLVERRGSPVRRYLYDKYVYHTDGDGNGRRRGD